MVFVRNQIRPLAVAVVRHKNKILAMEGYDSVKQETFYRLIGGGIEFGERAEDTVVREFREELGLDIKVTRFLGVSENIFTYEGKPGHEIVLFFEAEFVAREMYDKEIRTIEKELSENRIVWVEPVENLHIYPEGFRKYIL